MGRDRIWKQKSEFFVAAHPLEQVHVHFSHTCSIHMRRIDGALCYGKMLWEQQDDERMRSNRGKKEKIVYEKRQKATRTRQGILLFFFDNLFTPPASMDQSEILIFPSIVNITYCSSSKRYAVCCCLVELEMETLFFMCFNRKRKNLWNFFHSRKDNKISVDRGERALYKVIHHHPYPNGFKHTREIEKKRILRSELNLWVPRVHCVCLGRITCASSSLLWINYRMNDGEEFTAAMAVIWEYFRDFHLNRWALLSVAEEMKRRFFCVCQDNPNIRFSVGRKPIFRIISHCRHSQGLICSHHNTHLSHSTYDNVHSDIYLSGYAIHHHTFLLAPPKKWSSQALLNSITNNYIPWFVFFCISISR